MINRTESSVAVPNLTRVEYRAISSLQFAELRQIVERIQSGDESGAEDLYRVLGSGMKWLLCRGVGPDRVEDQLHNLFVILVENIRKGAVRDPERLMGMARTIAHRQIAAHVKFSIRARIRQGDDDTAFRVASKMLTPEEALASRRKVDMMKTVLAELSQRDREILTKFYLKEQTQDQICREMGLNDTQFRLLKSRAKARFGELGRKALSVAKVVGMAKRAVFGAAA